MEIYLARNNQQAGPYSLEQVNQMLREGQVVLTDLMWHVGMPNWLPVGQMTRGEYQYQPVSIAPNPVISPVNTSTLKTPISILAGAKPATQSINLDKTNERYNVRIASIAKRLLGAAIDNVAVLIALLPFLDKVKDLNSNQFSNNPEVMAQYVMQHPELLNAFGFSFVLMLIMSVIQILLLVKRGQTLGKMLAGTRIVDFRTGKKAAALNSVVLRSIPTLLYTFLYIGMMVFLIDLALMLITPKRTSLHDMIAKTVVVDAAPEQLQP